MPLNQMFKGLNQPLNLSHNLTHQIITLVLLCIIWFMIYALVEISFHSKVMKNKEMLDTKNRIVSIIHGVVSFSCGSYQFLTNPVWNQPNTEFQAFICLFSLSYCIYDLIACIYYGLSDSGLVIHHGLCFLAFGASAFSGYGGIDTMGGLFTAQISNFPMHIRCLLRNYNRRYTKLYEVSENAYLILYIIARSIICPIFVFWPCIHASNTPIIVKLMSFSLIIQSIYYISKMYVILQKKKKQYKEMGEKKIQYNWLSENENLKKLSFYRKSDGPHVF